MHPNLYNTSERFKELTQEFPLALVAILLVAAICFISAAGLNWLSNKEYKPKKKGWANATHKNRTKILRNANKLGKRDTKRHDAG